MARPPRSQRPRVNKPSPLQQVQDTKAVSRPPPEMGLVRDPQFWKRFSTAVHIAEAEEAGESGNLSPVSSIGAKQEHDWLTQQRREKRKCRILCVSITSAVILAIIAAVVVAWYLRNNNKKPKGA